MEKDWNELDQKFLNLRDQSFIDYLKIIKKILIFRIFIFYTYIIFILKLINIHL